MRVLLTGIIAGYVALGASLDSAYAANQDCTSSALFGVEDFPVFRVKQGVDRLYFISSSSTKAPDCPSRTASCRSGSFLIAGNEVLVTWSPEPEGDMLCGHYIAPDGKLTSGWLDKTAMTVESDRDRVEFDAVEARGKWVNGLGDATIRIGPGYIQVEGEATRGPPSYNTGSFEGSAFVGEGANGPVAGYNDQQYRGETPASTPFRTDESGCRIRFRFAAHYLLVDDNDRCGGYGVTFSGIYVKQTVQKG